MSLSIDHFPAFFEALWNEPGVPKEDRKTPFPWQTMLAKRVHTDGAWPRGIDLPTASGKTACLDIALFTLALSAGDDNRPSLPRRIFFVVDRRIVVDAAHARATDLARKLGEAKDGVVGEVADRLRRIGSSDTPLHVSRQRGDVLRDDEWVNDPTQPAIITGTVDQIGSRLLFRAYGPGRLSQSVHAALVATDSLILLDEAHCARPFMQTAEWVQRYVGEDWCEVEQPIARPLEFVVLSATLPEDIPVGQRFPRQDARESALNHPELQKRINAAKPTELVVASKTPGKRRKNEHGVKPLTQAAEADHLVAHAANLAVKYAAKGRRRIAVMVNRVATAAAIYEQLRDDAYLEKREAPLDAGVVLLTGRMRPIDRDDVLNSRERHLKAGSKADPERPIILVTTQCLEVGADFDFDALITECASLDALRQRFGRLNRLGSFPETDAAVLHGKKPGKKHEDDPIYGEAMDATWAWLHERMKGECVDFGIDAMDKFLEDAPPADGMATLLAPSPDAPILLPAHVDLLCQTAPRPTPDPEVSLYLHGVDRGVPEARVVFRADLIWDDTLSPKDNEELWLEAVSLVRPVSGEMLTVPLYRLRQWLAGEDLRGWREDAIGDVESQRPDDDGAARNRAPGRRFVRWRGANRRGKESRSGVFTDPQEIKPNDIVIVQADREQADRLAHYFNRPEGASLDATERAYPASRGCAVLRVNKAVLKSFEGIEPVRALLEYAGECDREDENADRETVKELLAAIQDAPDADQPDQPMPEWLRRTAEACQRLGPRWPRRHPMGGFVLRSARIAASDGAEGQDEFADEDDTRSEVEREVSLDCHTSHVLNHAKSFAERLVPALADMFALAARLHDAGKADERFQAYLRNDPLGLAADGELLAKSAEMARTPAARARLRRQTELPDDFRHEMLSAALAEYWSGLPADPPRRDLILHLIASHHGHARPFAPVCSDDEAPSIQVALVGIDLAVTHDQRKERPAHRLDSGVAERFWRLTRRYGWWGLAYLEAILRLADWRASAEERSAPEEDLPASAPQPQEALG